MSIRLPVHLSAGNNSATAGRIFNKLDISRFFENLSRKFKFYSYLTIITGNLQEDIRTFIVSRFILLRMRNVSENVVEKIRAHILCSIFSPENRLVCEIMWKNMVQPDRSQVKI
jgi:hypothetical protein